MKKTSQLFYRATDTLIGSAINGVLYGLYIMGAGISKSRTSYGAYQVFREADEALRDFNYESFKQILSALRRKGYITKNTSHSAYDITLTRKGKTQIHSFIPRYQHERPWDGYLYLISYDIPETRHTSRNLLRTYLKRQGCACLQESLWLTPYNPRRMLDEFSDTHHIIGSMLVSRLGQDGAVGEETLSALLERVYHLSKLNDRYRAFIAEAKRSKEPSFALAVHYARILRDDPQLPFPLLPPDWLGDRAYAMLKRE